MSAWLVSLEGCRADSMGWSDAVAGELMSLVATDVQGSTELCEWNNFVADNAMVVHDETMRSQLGGFPLLRCQQMNRAM